MRNRLLLFKRNLWRFSFSFFFITLLSLFAQPLLQVVPDKMLPKLSVMSVCSSNPDSLKSFLKMLRGENVPECAPLTRVRARR